MLNRQNLIFILIVVLVEIKHLQAICDSPCFFQSWCSYRTQCNTLLKTTSIRPAEKVQGISSGCVKENGKDALKISWNQASDTTNLQYYMVNLREEGNEFDHCVCFNASRQTSFTFREKYSYKHKKNYDVAVVAIPVKQGDDITGVKIHGCPRIGAYQWTAWSDCECNDPAQIYPHYNYCIGKQTRSQMCLNKTDKTKEVDAIDCDERLIGTTEQTCNTTIPTPTTGQKETSNHFDEELTKKQLGVTVVAIIASVFGVTIIFMLYMFWRHRKRKLGTPPSPPPERAKRIYTSYYHSPKKTEIDLMAKLLRHIKEYVDVEIDVDILSLNEIDNGGGYHQWIPEKVMVADIFMIILTKEYLQVYNDSFNEKNDDELEDQVCKIRNELTHVSRRLHVTCQSEPKIILVLHGVRPEDFKDIPFFVGRPYHIYPKNFDLKDDDFLKLVGLLQDTNPFQISSV